ncbi:MAG TPA: tetratricopeptide repeat protein [Marmoricola sp.]|nr:tetratricopeptide repeat protein [Marmoricola sp.]
MDPYLADLSRTIDSAELGRRIRAARLAAGMTQAQVAGDEVSAAYLSRIEDGSRRPEVRLLERMAARMGTSLEDLLLDVSQDEARKYRLALDHAELSLVGGAPQTALDGVNAILDEIPEGQLPGLRRSAHQVRARALEAVGDLNGAIVALEELTATPIPDASWLRGLIALTRCYRDLGDVDRAIAVGERAATVIDDLGIQGLTEAIQLTVTVASAYHERGDVDHAMRLCMRALADAEKYDSPLAQASAYWNASVMETDAHGATPAALQMSQKALALFEVSEDHRNLSRLRSALASLQLAQEPPDPEGALETLDRAVRELEASDTSPADMSYALMIRGRAHLLLGDTTEALASAERGMEVAPKPSPYLDAMAGAIRGQVAALDGRFDDAREHYRQAVYSATTLGSDHHAAELWFELANLLAELGDHEGAVQAFRSAAAATGYRRHRIAPAPRLAD